MSGRNGKLQLTHGLSPPSGMPSTTLRCKRCVEFFQIRFAVLVGPYPLYPARDEVRPGLPEGIVLSVGVSYPINLYGEMMYVTNVYF